MNTNSQNEQQPQEAGLEQLDRTALLTLVKQVIQLHPDLSQLVDSLSATHKLHYEPLNAELYRLKVEQIFSSTDRNSWGSEGRAAEPLRDIMEIADAAAQQQDYTNAVLLYEIIVRGIFDNYDTFRWHADEGDLDTVIEECADGLGKCLREEQQDSSEERTRIIQILCDIYEFDMTLDNDEPVMSSKVPAMLIQHTTSAERKSIATRVRREFELEINWHTDSISEQYDRSIELLLGLEAETIDDETFLRVCRETENYPYLIERLLKLGRPEEALTEAQQVDTYYLPEVADIFCEQGYEEMALRLIEERSAQGGNKALLQWLQKHHQNKGNPEKGLDIACRLFHTSTTIEQYREIHQLAEPLGRWGTVQAELLTYVDQTHNIKLLIEIALDDGQVKEALELLESQSHPENLRNGPYKGDTFEVGLVVAQAAEENYPLQAIKIYQNYVETRIEWRGRENYHQACQHLLSMRKLFQKIDKSRARVVTGETARDEPRALPRPATVCMRKGRYQDWQSTTNSWCLPTLQLP